MASHTNPAELRIATVASKVTVDEYERIGRAAGADSRTVSDWVRLALLARLEELAHPEGGSR